jgi:hypothetical protein
LQAACEGRRAAVNAARRMLAASGDQVELGSDDVKHVKQNDDRDGNPE